MRSNPGLNYHPKCERLQITHLMFADDLLKFWKGGIVSVSLLFSAFMDLLELLPNLEKSRIYLCGIPTEIY